MLTQRGSDIGASAILVFTLHVHNIIVLQGRQKWLKGYVSGQLLSSATGMQSESNLNKTRMQIKSVPDTPHIYL